MGQDRGGVGAEDDSMGGEKKPVEEKGDEQVEEQDIGRGEGDGGERGATGTDIEKAREEQDIGRGESEVKSPRKEGEGGEVSAIEGREKAGEEKNERECLSGTENVDIGGILLDLKVVGQGQVEIEESHIVRDVRLEEPGPSHEAQSSHQTTREGIQAEHDSDQGGQDSDKVVPDGDQGKQDALQEQLEESQGRKDDGQGVGGGDWEGEDVHKSEPNATESGQGVHPEKVPDEDEVVEVRAEEAALRLGKRPRKPNPNVVGSP